MPVGLIDPPPGLMISLPVSADQALVISKES